jgi:type VI secretion system protein ImpJ
MNPLQPIFWRQGLFLQPHHFQHNDHLAQYRQHRINTLTMPYAWGVAAIELDEAALIDQSVMFSRLTVLMRDGLLIEYPGNAVLAARRFDLAELGAGRTLYIGVRRAQPDQANVRTVEHVNDAANLETRLAATAEPVETPDSYAGGPHGQVHLMSYVVRLFWEHEIQELGDYELMPVARLYQDGDQAKVHHEFIPPCLTVAASPALGKRLRQLRDEVVGRARQIEIFKVRGNAGARGVDLDAGHLDMILALSVLNHFGPALHQLLESPTIHPWEVDSLLRQLVGALSTFSDRCNMLGETRDGRMLLVPYRHVDPGPGLHALADLVRSQLNEIAAAPEMVVRMDPDGAASGYYVADLAEGFFGQRHRYHLVASGDVDAAQLASSMTTTAKMAAPGQIETLVTLSLPGLELLHLPQAPRGVPRRINAQYFRIDTMSEAWSVVTQEHRLALFLPDAPDSLHFELIVSKW